MYHTGTARAVGNALRCSPCLSNFFVTFIDCNKCM